MCFLKVNILQINRKIYGLFVIQENGVLGMSVESQYIEFLCQKLDKEMLCRYKNLKVLGANLINGILIALCEVNHGNAKVERFIFTIEKSKIKKYEIATSNNYSNYIVVNKEFLQRILPAKLYKIFVNNGLALSVKVGINEKGQCSWHRLVMCLYFSILSYEVHHIDTDEQYNSVINLTPIEKEEHIAIHTINNKKKLIKQGLNIRNAYIRYFNGLKRQTLVNNEEIVLSVLKAKCSGKKIKEIHKIINKKISIRSISNILKKYSSYRNGFIESLETHKILPFPDLNAKYKKRWSEVYEYKRILAA